MNVQGPQPLQSADDAPAKVTELSNLPRPVPAAVERPRPTLPPPKPLRPELAALKAKLEKPAANHASPEALPLANVWPGQPNSVEIQPRKEISTTNETHWPASDEPSAAGRPLGHSPTVREAESSATSPLNGSHLGNPPAPTVAENNGNGGAGTPTAESSHVVTRPGISPAALAMAKIRFVEADEGERIVGFKARGLAVPYCELDGSQIVGKNSRFFYRIRLAEPVGPKYLSAVGSGCEAYFPPALSNLLQPGCTLGIVEGEFKALSLVEAGFPCVGVGGISSVAPRDESGKPTLLPRLARLIATFRPAKLAFIGDSDTALIADFAREAVKLAKLSGVPVVLPRIPLDAPGKGPDDLRELAFQPLAGGHW